jgi:hypothetical protein
MPVRRVVIGLIRAALGERVELVRGPVFAGSDPAR